MFTAFLRLVQFEFRRFKGRSKLALFFILIIPLLYGGIYLHANWDLYNNTDKVKIAVVNHDVPASFDGRTVNGGEEFEKALKENPRFDWQFMGTDDEKAHQGLTDGEYFMVITVPESFSSNLVSAGNYKPARATLKLTRDDANGFIIGLLTSQVENVLGKTLDQSVSQTYFSALFVNLNTIKDSLGKAADGSKQLKDGMKTLNAGVNEMNDKVLAATKGTKDLQAATANVNAALDNADAASTNLTSAVNGARTGATNISNAARNVAADAQAVNDATIPVVNQVAKALPQWQKQAGDLVHATGTLTNPNGPTVVTIQHNLNGAASATNALVANHPELAKDANYLALVKQIEAASKSTTTVTSNVAAVADISAGLNVSLNQQNADTLAGNITSALKRLNDDAAMVGTGLGQLNDSMTTAEIGARQIDASVHQATQAGRILTGKAPEALNGLAQLTNGLGQLKAGAGQLDKGAQQLNAGLQTGYEKLPSLSEDQRANMADVMSSPVDVEQTVLNPARYYGRGLAPMFFSIAMWIACISTFLVVRTISGRALTGRASSLRIALVGFGPLALIAVVGALIMALGVWVFLGLDPVHPWGFLGFVLLCSVSWMALAFWIRMILGSPQTAVFLILLVMQLPTCGGTFPVTMLPPFYQKLSVFMPLKYSVDTFRVLISGGTTSVALLGVAVQAGILLVSAVLIVLLVRRHKLFRMRDLHPPMVTSTTTADYAFSVRPR